MGIVALLFHFHHKLVYEALVMVIKYSHEKIEEVKCKSGLLLFSSGAFK